MKDWQLFILRSPKKKFAFPSFSGAIKQNLCTQVKKSKEKLSILFSEVVFDFVCCKPLRKGWIQIWKLSALNKKKRFSFKSLLGRSLSVALEVVRMHTAKWNIGHATGKVGEGEVYREYTGVTN
jgi:hypothetical protein